MPKENRRSGSRGSNWQQSSDGSDDGRRSTLRETPTIVGSVNRFTPFQREVPRRESRSNKEENLTTLVPPTDSSAMTSGIIENGMRYIMFPLHLLRFCIFGTTTLSIDDKEIEKKTSRVIEPFEEKNKEKEREKRDKAKDTKIGSKDKEKKEEKRSSSESKKIVKDKESSRYDSKTQNQRVSKEVIEVVEKSSSVERKSIDSRKPDEDSDSSSCDKWSTAESSMDISIDCGNVIDTSYRLEEPMDISIEEWIDDKSLNSPRKVSHRSGSSRVRADPSSSSSSFSSRSWSIEIEESSSSSSIEEEIARVFQRKCTSSSNDADDDGNSPPSNSRVRDRRNEPDRRDYEKRENVVSRGSIHDSKVKFEKERVKPNARRKEESVRDKSVEKRTTPSKTSSSCGCNVTSPRRVSRTPSKIKNTKKRYKDKGIQTDSAFSDDDVEMIPLDTRLSDKRSSSRLYRHKPHSLSRQIERMDHDILYIADNEDSNDSYGRYSRNRISSIGESSSSTDLGFEEQRCRSSSSRSPVAETKRPKSFLCNEDDDNDDKDDRQKTARLPRAPPGFPQVPQNPPIPVKNWNDRDSFGLPFARETNPSVPQYGQSYPPAPTPMRHLYHEYPEFMPFPEEIGANRIFQTSLANGYLF